MNKMKKLSLMVGSVVLSSFSLNVLAYSAPYPYYDSHRNATCGIYVGGQIGVSDLHYDRVYDNGDFEIEDKLLTGRLMVGLDINPNAALELGYTLYQNPVVKSRYGYGDNDFNQQSLDILGKLSVPMAYNFKLYAKGGVAYVVRSFSVDNTTFIDDNWRPMLGFGVNYAFDSRVSADVGYLRTFGTGNLADADFYGAGLTIKVG
jgi:opacity protein-like surface antigen